MRITGTNGQLPRKALESTLLDTLRQIRQGARQGPQPHSTDDAAVSPGKRPFSLAR